MIQRTGKPPRVQSGLEPEPCICLEDRGRQNVKPDSGIRLTEFKAWLHYKPAVWPEAGDSTSLSCRRNGRKRGKSMKRRGTGL